MQFVHKMQMYVQEKLWNIMWNLPCTHIIHRADNLMYSFMIIQSNMYIRKVKNTFWPGRRQAIIGTNAGMMLIYKI